VKTWRNAFYIVLCILLSTSTKVPKCLKRTHPEYHCVVK